MPQKPASQEASRGKLRIGNDWNAITIIALSQSNPLKAIAEFVENSIDARASTITIVRGRGEGSHYLEVRDDGQGIPRDAEGRPAFGMSPRISATQSSAGSKWKASVDCKASLASACFHFGPSAKS